MNKPDIMNDGGEELSIEEWKAQQRREIAEADRQARKEEGKETASDKLLTFLQEIAGRSTPPVDFSLKKKNWGVTTVRFGEEYAVMILHINDGVGRLYTPMLDIQQPWWKEAFIDKLNKGGYQYIGLIEPSLWESTQANTETVFSLKAVMQQAGLHIPEDMKDEYSEQVVYANPEKQQSVLSAIDIVKKVMSPLLAPHYQVTFDTGNGDYFNKLRLHPLTPEAQSDILNNSELYTNALSAITSAIPQIVQELRNTGASS
jgi:hypothetical protein